MIERKFNALRRGCSTLAISLAISMAGVTVAQAQSAPIAFNITAKNTAQALMEFSKQAKVQILFPYDEAAKFSAPALKGELSRDAALAKLLAGTTLEIASASDTVISLKVSEKRSETPNASAPQETVEVIVTGSYIRGAQPTSPVQTLSRKEIDQSGYSQTGDLMRSVPQTFSGGQNPGIQTTNSNYNNNLTGSSTVNLRGLGSDSTLTLLNGRRLANDGFFSGPDVSSIPLAALQRIEIVTDGASALYGSDAVAGVVNFILRDDYEGVDVAATVGDSAEGGGLLQNYNILAGQAWDTGHVMGSVEYFHQDPILYSQRDFTSTGVPTNALLQAQERKSSFVAFEQAITENLSFRSDVLYSERFSGSDTQNTPTATKYTGRKKAHALLVNPGFTYAFDNGWTIDAEGSFSRNANGLYSYNHTNKRLSGTFYTNKTRSFDVKATGTLFSLPGGPAKFAGGIGYRKENYFDTGNGNGERTVDYGFGELYLPFVDPAAGQPGLRAFDVSLAVRVENYSDFGETTNPKVGVRYMPLSGVALRATWGKSFKAPSLYQLIFPHTAYIYGEATVGGTGNGQVLFDFGGNPDLGPQRAESWTAGIDWNPEQWRSFSVNATYFNVDYTDRITYPVTVVARGLVDAQYAPFITRNPSPALQAEVIAGANFFYNFSGQTYDPSKVIAYFYDRYTNVSGQHIEGLDLNVRKAFVLAASRLDTFVNASWLQLDQQITAAAPAQTLTGTVFNPAEARIRAGGTWHTGGLSATLIGNYISGGTDNVAVPNTHIKSWTTADLNVAYRFQSRDGVLSGLQASIAVSNLLNEAPSYAKGPSANSPGVFFDSTNTSPIGRFVSISLKKHF